jgi:serine/threonine protein phosphatase PrpC
MVVTCPNCGAISRDREFCDHCNTDLAPPAAAVAPGQCPIATDLSIPLSPEQVALLTRPEASVVLRAKRQAWRVHWIAEDAWPNWLPAVQQRCDVSHSVLAPCRWVADAGGTWVIAQAGQPAHSWLRPAADDPLEELRRLTTHVEQVAAAVDALREAGWQWLTFEPRELEYAPSAQPCGTPVQDATLRLTNLDLGLIAVDQCPAQVLFSPRYAAPEVCRFDAALLGPATDVFHLGMLAYYWLARLLPAGFLGQGLEAFGHNLPPLRIYAPALLPGIAPVLEKALAAPVGDRFAKPSLFCAALREAVDRAGQRQMSAVPVSWEVATHTRTGKAKQALQRSNEDAVLALDYEDPSRSLVVVADGITTCDIGNGALASLLTCLALQNTFDATCNAENFAERITGACRRGAENLLAWALEHGQRLQLEAGAELMGTTLTAGWLEGNQLQIANLGDSRAYLIGPDFVEKLTVDGNLGTSLLAAGAAPEHVVELGGMARALRECVGGCDRTPDGQITVVERHNHPALSRWTLLPDEYVILCSDGLIEEGLYLEPAQMEQLVRRHADRPVDELANLLADAADDRQRLASPLEPEGMGDNISCVVVRIVAKEQVTQIRGQESIGKRETQIQTPDS